MNTTRVVIVTGVLILAAIGINTYISLHDHLSLASYVRAESIQRVHTIGERCEQEEHQALERGPQERWFWQAQHRCLKSLAKVEARAGVTYTP